MLSQKICKYNLKIGKWKFCKFKTGIFRHKKGRGHMVQMYEFFQLHIHCRVEWGLMTIGDIFPKNKLCLIIFEKSNKPKRSVAERSKALD